MRKAIDILRERKEGLPSVREEIDQELDILFQALQENDQPQVRWSKMRLSALSKKKPGVEYD